MNVTDMAIKAIAEATDGQRVVYCTRSVPRARSVAQCLRAGIDAEALIRTTSPGRQVRLQFVGGGSIDILSVGGSGAQNLRGRTYDRIALEDVEPQGIEATLAADADPATGIWRYQDIRSSAAAAAS